MTPGWPLPSILAALAVLVAFVAICVFGAHVVPAAVRRAWFESPAALLFGAGVFLAALLARWLLPLPGLVHENHHGMHLLASAPLTQDGSSHVFLAQLPVALFGDPGWHFAVSRLLSAAAVTGVFALSRALFGSTAAALLPAALLVLQPLSIVLSSSESYLVTAAACFPWGLYWMHRGGQRGDRAAYLLGVLLLCFAALAREITLLLSPAIPVMALAVLGRPRRGRWAWHAAAWLVPLVLLLPRLWITVELILATESPTFLEVPRSFLPETWIAFLPPWMPPWQAALGLAGLLGAVAAGLYRRRWTLVLALVAAVLIPDYEGRFVHAGWFPALLRHRYVIAHLFVLPTAWLALHADRWLAQVHPLLRAAPVALALLAGGITLAGQPESVRWPLPALAEDRFFREVVPSLPTRARFVVAFHENVIHPPPGYFSAINPGWRHVALDEVGEETTPLFAVLDRACFANPACYEPEGCRGARAQRGRRLMVETSHGTMVERCAALLRIGAVEAVAELELTRPRVPAVDFPPFDDVVRIAVLRVTTQAPTPSPATDPLPAP